MKSPQKTLKLLMLCGIPCSGKTTYQNKLDRYQPLSTDWYILYEAKRQNRSYNDVFNECIKDAQNYMEKYLRIAIENGYNIVWDQTNITPKTRKSKLNKVPNYYEKIAVVFNVPLELALERNKNRTEQCLPEEVIRSMHSKFVVPTLEEGFDKIEYIS